MKALYTKLDEQDLLLLHNIGRWVVLSWRDGLFPPPKGEPYGTHLAAFIYCHQGEEIKGLVACWLVQSESGGFFKSCPPFTGIEVTWLLKHSTLKKLGATSLTNTQIETLCLPNKVENVCGNNVPQHIKEIRLNKKFDNFRSSRFPDNVRTLLEHDNKDDSDIPMTGEFIWVRLYAAISETEFEGKLLNQPMVGSLSMGEKVLVKMENKENGEVLTCQKQESRMVKIDSTFFNSEFKNDLLDKATGAPTLFRLVFEVLERRLSQEFPQLLLAPHWDAFIGVGTVAGCQLISMHLHHEIPAEFRTELEMKIKGSLELGYPKSAPFWEDSSRFFRDNLLDIPRPDRSRIAFRIQSEWIILHVTGGKELEKQHEISLRLAGYLKHEVPGYWSSIQDHSGN